MGALDAHAQAPFLILDVPTKSSACVCTASWMHTHRHATDVPVLLTNSGSSPLIELFVDFDIATEVQEDPEMGTERQTILEENLKDSENEFEVNYKIDDKDEDAEEGKAIVAVQTSSNPPTDQHSFDVSPCTRLQQSDKCASRDATFPLKLLTNPNIL
ncbi:hypothetical protein PIB30_086558 [Stylosanthes scabra]|uniref:Uncharacterized protein n=1 Tax=Stylosanthes scabra TaxID=79078 RepID=A0ABU6UVV6_9FABA|nr:hypothetical protein [Stylosanthes scabra]